MTAAMRSRTMLSGALALACAVLLLAPATGHAQTVRPACPGRHASDDYFPAGSLAWKADPGRFESGWYSSDLAAMAEPSLSCATSGRVYRFLWLRSFDHPIAVRVVTGATPSIVAVELSGAGGYDPGKIKRRIRRTLAKEEFDRLEAAVSAAELPTLPAFDDSSVSVDGAEWIVEIADHGRYNVVSRTSPGAGTFRQLGLAFLAISGLQTEPLY